MKNAFFAIAIAAVSFAACNNANNKSAGNTKMNTDSAQAKEPAGATETKGTVSVKGIVSCYLRIKNALVNDDAKEAANSGKAIVDAIEKLDTTVFTPEQKKAYNNVADDVKENAEHIGANKGKIDHQREHFEMLSTDIYDLVKTFGGGQSLYKDFCPMYNNGKGAVWISETKEIKNPYLGKKMPTCGTLKEEIK